MCNLECILILSFNRFQVFNFFVFAKLADEIAFSSFSELLVLSHQVLSSIINLLFTLVSSIRYIRSVFTYILMTYIIPDCTETIL
jgi:hypothetical protein